MNQLAKKMSSAVFVVLLLLFNSALAETTEEKCSADYYDVVKSYIKIKTLVPVSQGGNVISETCKTWPYNNALVLSAFAYDEGVEYEKKLIVAVIDTKTMRVISAYRSVIREDAVTEVGTNSLRLDTAKYQLAKDVRAFGLRFISSAIGASCGEARWNDELTLFVPSGRKLLPVLSMNMYQQKSIQGCLSTFSPDAIWEDAVLSVGIENTNTKGFNDLMVTAKITVGSNGAPIEKIKNRVERHVLRYNGKYYEKESGFPWWLETM